MRLECEIDTIGTDPFMTVGKFLMEVWRGSASRKLTEVDLQQMKNFIQTVPNRSKPGHYLVKLMNNTGKVIDHVMLEVE